MDFLDPKKRRSHTIRLFIGYCLVTLALILASLLLLFAAFGWGINRTTGEVIQNGLLFVDAHPQAATMYINGQEKGQTDGRFVLEAGNYTLELKRDQYRPWKRDFTLEGGKIVRLVYPFLFPVSLDNRDLLPFSTPPDMVTESPDRRFVLIHNQANPLNIQIVDTSKKELPVTTIAISQTVLGTHPGTQSMEMVEWSTDNRHVLVKNTFSGGYDFLVIDREQPDSSFNVTQTFSRGFTNVTLRDKKFDQLYLLDGASGQLLSGNAATKATSLAASGVLEFWPYKDNTLVYTTAAEAPVGKVFMKVKEGQATYSLRELAKGEGYLLNMAEFDGDSYIVGCSKADGKVYIYKNPTSDLKKSPTENLVPAYLMKLENPEYLSFSAIARFISVQSGSQFSVYDLETEQHYKYDAKIAIPAGEKARWMDGHRLMLIGADNKMRVFDYDGLNPQTLVTTNPAFVPLFDRDYNQLFTVGPTKADASKQGLIRTDLNLGQD